MHKLLSHSVFVNFIIQIYKKLKNTYPATIYPVIFEKSLLGPNQLGSVISYYAHHPVFPIRPTGRGIFLVIVPDVIGHDANIGFFWIGQLRHEWKRQDFPANTKLTLVQLSFDVFLVSAWQSNLMMNIRQSAVAI
jgi:hypothetical protein